MRISTTSTIIPSPLPRQPTSLPSTPITCTQLWETTWFVLLNSNCSLLRAPLERGLFLVGSKGACVVIRWRSQWSIDLWQKCLFKGATPLASGEPSARKHSPVTVLHLCSAVVLPYPALVTLSSPTLALKRWTVCVDPAHSAVLCVRLMVSIVPTLSTVQMHCLSIVKRCTAQCKSWIGALSSAHCK